MQNAVLERPRRKKAVARAAVETQQDVASSAHATAFTQIARETVQVCRSRDAQKELERRHNEPGQ